VKELRKTVPVGVPSGYASVSQLWRRGKAALIPKERKISQAPRPERPTYSKAMVDPDQGSRQQENSGEHLNGQISDPGPHRPVRTPGPDQYGRADGKELPEHEQGDEVPCKDGT